MLGDLILATAGENAPVTNTSVDGAFCELACGIFAIG